jgi:hypothetical protein
MHLKLTFVRIIKWKREKKKRTILWTRRRLKRETDEEGDNKYN